MHTLLALLALCCVSLAQDPPLPRVVLEAESSKVKDAVGTYQRKVAVARDEMEKVIEAARARFEALEAKEREKLLRVASTEIKDYAERVRSESKEVEKAVEVFFRTVEKAKLIPVANLQVCLVSPDGVSLAGTTDSLGKLNLKLRPGVKSYTLLCGGPEVHALRIDGFDPKGSNILEVSAYPGGGSGVFLNEYGHIPGLKGSIGFLADGGEHYAYAENIAINGGEEQPVDYVVGEWMTFEDEHSRVFAARVVGHAKPGTAVLHEYSLKK